MFAAVRKGIKEQGEYRLGRRGSFLGRFAFGRLSLNLKLCKFEESWSLLLFGLWVTICQSDGELGDEMMLSWGLCHHERSIHLNWGARCKVVYLPWMYDHCRTEVMLRDGSFVPYEKYPCWKNAATRPDNWPVPEPAEMFSAEYPFRYVLKSGEVQDRVATVTAERRSWCWHGWPFRWLRWPSKTRTSIDVKFSDEVGERSGSWKGGVIGTGYELRQDESPPECLRRMEREWRC